MTRVLRNAALLIAGTAVGFALLSLAGKPLQAGWNTWTTAGLKGGPASSIGVDAATAGVVYAGTGAGVYKSTDSGAHWTLSSAGITASTRVICMAQDPSMPATLYAGVSGTPALYKSTDGGATWNASATGLSGYAVLALAVDPSTPSTLYASTQGDGICKSIDGGAHWSSSNVGIEAASFSEPLRRSLPAVHPLRGQPGHRSLQEHRQRRDLGSGQHEPACGIRSIRFWSHRPGPPLLLHLLLSGSKSGPASCGAPMEGSIGTPRPPRARSIRPSMVRGAGPSCLRTCSSTTWHP